MKRFQFLLDINSLYNVLIMWVKFMIYYCSLVLFELKTQLTLNMFDLIWSYLQSGNMSQVHQNLSKHLMPAASADLISNFTKKLFCVINQNYQIKYLYLIKNKWNNFKCTCTIWHHTLQVCSQSLMLESIVDFEIESFILFLPNF